MVRKIAIDQERIGKGNLRSERAVKRIVIQFDDETFDAIRVRAVKAGTSFAEQVRLLVEWGLEDAR